MEHALQSVTVDLPVILFQQIISTAQQKQQSISDFMRDFVTQNWNTYPHLPDDVEDELAAFDNLSDDVLWMIAHSALSPEKQQLLADLNYESKHRELAKEEKDQREQLLDDYDRIMIRRAHAISILKSRNPNFDYATILARQDTLGNDVVRTTFNLT